MTILAPIVAVAVADVSTFCVVATVVVVIGVLAAVSSTVLSAEKVTSALTLLPPHICEYCKCYCSSYFSSGTERLTLRSCCSSCL